VIGATTRRFLLGVVVVGSMFLAWSRFRDGAERSDHGPASPSAGPNQRVALPSAATTFSGDASADRGLTHVDPRRRAEILAQILAAMQADADPPPEPSAATPGTVLGSRRPLRATNDVEAAARFVQERIREDFVPMAKGCYRELLARKPEAEGDVMVGFEVVGDESVGGVVNSAEIRDESTLRDESLETCLRESFLSVYFDPPPAHAALTVRFPFHFAHGEVDGSHELHLRDRRRE
jgi:hypothetical protein